jgi:putative membrane protein
VVAHSLTAADRARIAAAVAKAEAQTGVEIRLVLAHSSSHYGAFALIYPALLALVAGGAAAAWVSDLAATDLFIGQALLFAAGVAILQSQALRQAFAPARVKRKAAWRHARLHYASIGLKQPHTHNLVLVFCSIAERSIEILVDDAIHEKLPEPVWQPIVAAFKAELAKGRVADAFVNVAGACAAVLGPSFPPEPGRVNEIPDELVEI